MIVDILGISFTSFQGPFTFILIWSDDTYWSSKDFDGVPLIEFSSSLGLLDSYIICENWISLKASSLRGHKEAWGMLHQSGFFMNRLHKTVSTIFCYYFDLLSTFKESLFRNILRSQCRNPILVCLAIMFRNAKKIITWHHFLCIRTVWLGQSLCDYEIYVVHINRAEIARSYFSDLQAFTSRILQVSFIAFPVSRHELP